MAQAQRVLDKVKAAPTQEGTDAIHLPGERSAARAAQVQASGQLELQDSLLQSLREVAAGDSSNTSDNGAAAGTPGDDAGVQGGTAKAWGVATKLAHPSNAGVHDPYASMATPLYQTATFKQPSAVENGPYDYTRSGNPTRDILEQNMAELEGGVRGLAFVTGMAAINAACRLVKSGARAVSCMISLIQRCNVQSTRSQVRITSSNGLSAL